MYDPQEYEMTPPQPPTDADACRVNEQAMRWSVLNSAWRIDALWRENTFFSAETQAMMPEPEIAESNDMAIVSPAFGEFGPVTITSAPPLAPLRRLVAAARTSSCSWGSTPARASMAWA